MEFDVYRDWAVRDITWCLLCQQREENGAGAGLCAHCQGLNSELEEMCRS